MIDGIRPTHDDPAIGQDLGEVVELNRVSGGIFAQSNVDVTGLGLPTLTGAGANSVLPPVTPTQAPPVTRNPSPQH